jgi:hypothetical protein
LMAYSFPSCPARFDPGTLQRHHPSTRSCTYSAPRFSRLQTSNAISERSMP